jgi:opacity protein-like surface antigen
LVLKRTFFLLLAVFASRSALAQAKPLVSRAGDIQAGGGYTYGTADYASDHVQGYTFYADFDPLRHIGAEVVFHQLKDYNNPTLYERSYEAGGRYFKHYGEYSDYTPYVKALYGRGVYNFPPYPLPAPQNIAAGNLAYNMFVAGAGIDVALTTHINARADFEYQHWLGGLGLPNGLTPIVVTIGFAYHVPAGKPNTLTR